MRRLLLFIFSLVVGVVGANAQNDTFTKFEEVLGKHIRLLSGDISEITYVAIDEKLKPVKKDKKRAYVIGNNSYVVDSAPYIYKKKNYIVLRGKYDTFYLKEEEAPMYLSYMRNETLWDNFLKLLNDNYQYMDVEAGKQYHDASAGVRYDKLSKIAWYSYTWRNAEIEIKGGELDTNDSFSHSFTITPSGFNSLKDLVFIKNDAVQPYKDKYEARLAKEKREKEIKDSIYNCQLRLAVTTKDLTFGEGDDEIDVAEDDTVAVYSYRESSSKFLACYHANNILLNESDIKFIDLSYEMLPHSNVYGYTSPGKNYLMKVGEKGLDDRYKLAYEYDSIRTMREIREIQAKIEVIKQGMAYLKTNQIFITKAGYNYDDSQFGMDYTFYNCFNKVIKYVALRLVCYNNVGDVQRDYFGSYTKTVRGIGPIAPGEFGTYSWEKIFLDEYDVIKNCNITSITFTFKDGTKKTYTGTRNIEKHFSRNAWRDNDDSDSDSE